MVVMAAVILAAGPLVAPLLVTADGPASPASASGVASSTNLGNVDDPLQGRREVLSVDDLYVVGSQSESGSAVATRDHVFETANGVVASESTSSQTIASPCGYSTTAPYPERAQIGRLFDLANDVIVTLTPSAQADGTTCGPLSSGDASAQLTITDILDASHASTTSVAFPDAQYLQLALADFDGDGYDDVLAIGAQQIVVATAADVSTPSAGLTIASTTSLTSTSGVPVGDVGVGDLNDDGNLDVVWVGDSADSASPGNSAYIATVCAGSIAGTVCDAHSSFDVVVSSTALSLGQDTGFNSDGSIAALPPASVTVGLFNTSDNNDAEALVVTAPRNGVEGSATATLYAFDSDLNPTTIGSISPLGGITSHGFINVYATAGYLDWFSSFQQAVVFVGDKQQDNPYIAVLDSNGSALTVLGSYSGFPTALETDQVFVPGGLALAVLGTPSDTSDPANFNPQIVAYYYSDSDNYPGTALVTYGLSPSTGDWNPAVSAVKTYQSGDYAQAYAWHGSTNIAGSLLAAGDLQGRSVRLGNPLVVRATSIAPQIVLGVPPMHVDYILPDPSTGSSATVVNFTANPPEYYVQYATAVTDADQSAQEGTTSYSYGNGVTTSGGVAFEVPVVQSISASGSAAWSYMYEQEVSTTYDTYTSASFDASTDTGLADQVWFTEQQFNVYYYPVLGQTSCLASDGSDCTTQYPLYYSVSGPSDITTYSAEGNTLEWYQPVHEPGQVFSYPWNTTVLEDAVDDPTLLSQTATIYTDTQASTTTVSWSADYSTTAAISTTTSYEQEQSLSMAVGTPDLDEAEEGAQVSVAYDHNSSTANTTLNSSTASLGASTGVSITKGTSGTFLDYQLYQYAVTPLIYGEALSSDDVQGALADENAATGALRALFLANPTDFNSGTWWTTSNYAVYPDLALNHPGRWTVDASFSDRASDLNCLYSTVQSAFECASFIAADPDDLWNNEFYRMRGLFVTVNSGAGTQRDQATAGDTVYLTARVYNYSLTAMPAGTTVHVRFYRQAWDTTSNSAAADAVLISEYASSTAIPPFNSSSDPDDPNWQAVSTSFATDDLGDTYWVFWVVVWMEDTAGDLVQEVPCHGLGAVPGTLTGVGDVVLETSATDSACGSSTSYSNNVGFYNSVFYVEPSASTAGAAALRRAANRPGGGRRARQAAHPHFTVHASNEHPAVHERVELTIELTGSEATDDGTTLAILDESRLVDYEVLPHIRDGATYRTSVAYRPSTAGEHRIEVRARHLTTAAQTTITVSGPPPTPGAADDDGCAITPPGPRRDGAAALLLGALLLILASAPPTNRRRPSGPPG
jgi:hypothetical protein